MHPRGSLKPHQKPKRLQDSEILTHKTIFDDRTTDSEYPLQYLTAFQPREVTVGFGQETFVDNHLEPEKAQGIVLEDETWKDGQLEDDTTKDERTEAEKEEDKLIRLVLQKFTRPSLPHLIAALQELEDTSTHHYSSIFDVNKHETEELGSHFSLPRVEEAFFFKIRNPRTQPSLGALVRRRYLLDIEDGHPQLIIANKDEIPIVPEPGRIGGVHSPQSDTEEELEVLTDAKPQMADSNPHDGTAQLQPDAREQFVDREHTSTQVEPQPSPIRIIRRATTNYESRSNDLNLMDLKSASKDFLIEKIAQLTAQNDELKTTIGIEEKPANVQVITAPKWRTMYRVEKQTFLWEPFWASADSGRFILRTHAPITSTKDYLSRHEEIAFVEFKDFKPKASPPPSSSKWADLDELPRPEPYKESVKLTSDAMVEAMGVFVSKLPEFSTRFPDFSVSAELPAPYLFWYHFRDHVDMAMKSLHQEQKDLMGLFRYWIEKEYEGEWQFVDSQFHQGPVSPITMKYLIHAQDVLVSNVDGIIESYLAKGCLEAIPDLRKTFGDELLGRAASGMTAPSELSGDQVDQSDASLEKSHSWSWSIESWRWSFDGSFKQAGKVLNLRFESESLRNAVAITSLSAFPLKYAGDEVKAILQRRGHAFWKCRKRRLVSYDDPHSDEMAVGVGRYMVDVVTYIQYRRKKEKDKMTNAYHHGANDNSKATSLECDPDTQVGPAKFDWEDFPDSPELFVFPSTVIAFDLRRKTWTDLDVDRIRDVTWNLKAFDSLAIDDEEKVLIEALVTTQISASRGTDLITYKGNGLIMLLHGGPGTGKTFTAESIADFAKKPLYRVTCGDIGTNPEQVEVYLESVLNLGTLWDCVVLLDEADVFLESRSQHDLARNALVSVFLRILEYYQGILILTSNRVGSFDEAFKSRIQLAIYYRDLSLAQRRKVWRNFMDNLKSLGEESVDYDDINDHIEELVGHNMNGRQIRNMITTGRQLARFHGRNMRFSDLAHAINVSSRFETYIKEVKSNMTDADLKRMEGTR